MGAAGFEVVIIGGGVIGSSIAYHLARRGRQVLVVERAGVASEPAASWASAGGVRRQGRHPAEAQLAIEAIERWKTLEQELEAGRLHYRRGGQLLLAESEDGAEYLATFVQQQQEMGFSDVRLVTREEVHRLVSGLGKQVITGSYSPRDGQADPPRTTRAFALAAQRLGATYWTGTAALALSTRGARVTGVRTARREVEAEQVVLAAGAWSDELALTFGLRLPVRTYALQMLLTSAAERVTLRPVLSAVNRHLSLKQLQDGAYFIGGGWLGDITADRRGFRTRPASIEGSWASACEVLPAVGRQRVARAWCGLEALSIDGIPFIGALAGIERLTLAVGFSGHGFAIAPAVGRAVADQMHGQATPELDGLSPARMLAFEPGQVEQFLTAPGDKDTLE